MKTPAKAALLLSVTILLSSCAPARESESKGQFAGTSNESGQRTRVLGHASSALPGDSLEDWVTYGDLATSATVVGIKRVEPSEQEKSSGQAIAQRIVTVVVDKVLWRSNRGTEVPHQVIFPAGGWLIEDSSAERELGLADAVQFEKGHKYLIPIVIEPSLSREWQPLMPDVALPFDSEVVGEGEEVKVVDVPSGSLKDASSANSALWGLSASEVVARLRETPSNPLADGMNDLSPVERSVAVQKREQEQGVDDK